jgi:hypothetical protein
MKYLGEWSTTLCKSGYMTSFAHRKMETPPVSLVFVNRATGNHVKAQYVETEKGGRCQIQGVRGVFADVGVLTNWLKENL